jgi:hypothetical protein
MAVLSLPRRDSIVICPSLISCLISAEALILGNGAPSGCTLKRAQLGSASAQPHVSRGAIEPAQRCRPQRICDKATSRSLRARIWHRCAARWRGQLAPPREGCRCVISSSSGDDHSARQRASSAGARLRHPKTRISTATLRLASREETAVGLHLNKRSAFGSGAPRRNLPQNLTTSSGSARSRTVSLSRLGD